MQEVGNKTRMEPMQLIDQHKVFTKQALAETASKLGNCGKNYYVIAIIGVQNSGKSTLLNYLFGTDFQVLKTNIGNRTTRGILTSLDKEQNLIIMDVEGNDSQERSHDLEYEKMVSSFALMSANVLIINIFSKNLGQYSGSQYESLKIIMDICIGQFKQESPKTIFFCVRDYNEEVDEEAEIRSKIIRDVTKIWENIEKPEQIKKYQKSPERFFTIQVAVLRKYKQNNPKQFLKDVEKIRQKFTVKSDDGYLFKKQSVQYNLPIQDFVDLEENSWKSIVLNKKLNLPAQKEQLASYRCSDISNQIQKEFKNDLQSAISRKEIIDFGALQKKYIDKFNLETYHYPKTIVEDKLKFLEDFMGNEIKRSIATLVDENIKVFEERFTQKIDKIYENPTKSLQEEAKVYMDDSIGELVQLFKSMNYQVPNRKQRIDSFTQKLKNLIKQVINRKTQEIKDQFWTESSRTMRLFATEMLRQNFGGSLWPKTSQKFQIKKNELFAVYSRKINWARGTSVDANQTDQVFEKLQQELIQIFKAELEKSLLTRAFDYFIRLFTKDKDGTPYNFTILEDDKINEIFEESRAITMILIKCVDEISVSYKKKASIVDFGGEQNHLFDSSWLSNLNEEIDKKMRQEYDAVIRRKKQNKMKKVPWYIFALIFYFVYDDIWFSQENYPILHYVLTFLLMVIILIFAVGQGSIVHEVINLIIDKVSNRVTSVKKKAEVVVNSAKQKSRASLSPQKQQQMKSQ